MAGVFRLNAVVVVAASILISAYISAAIPVENNDDHNMLHTPVSTNEHEYSGVPSPLSASPGGVVAKTLADMDNWKRILLEEASRYRGLPGTTDGIAFMDSASMASPLLAAADKQSQPMRNENERQAFCAYVSNDYTEQMGKMLQRLEASCRGKKRDDKQHANKCEMARSASRQFLNVIQLIQHNVCPDLGLF